MPSACSGAYRFKNYLTPQNPMKSKIFLLLLIWATCAQGQSLDSILESIAKNNPNLKTLREQNIAQSYELQASNTLGPTSIEYSPFFRRGYDGIATSELIITQELDFPTLYAARSKSAELQQSALESDYRLQLRDYLYQGVETYLQLVYTDKQHQNLSRRLADLRELSRLADKRAAAGDLTALDANRIKIQIMELESALLANETESLTLLNTLSLLTGNPIERGGEGLSYPNWQIPTEPMQQLATKDAEVQKFQADVTATNQELNVAKQGWLPNLTVGYRRNTEASESFNGFVVGAAFPLFTSGKTVKAAKAKKAAAVVAAQTAQWQAEQELQNTLNELRMLQRSMATYNLQLIDETESLLLKSVQHGQTTITAYLTETLQLNEKRAAYLSLEHAYHLKLSLLLRPSL